MKKRNGKRWERRRKEEVDKTKARISRKKKEEKRHGGRSKSKGVNQREKGSKYCVHR